MKTLLAIVLILTLLAAGLLVTSTVTAQCSPEQDPTCHQQCPRDGVCGCTWEPGCPTPPPEHPKPTGTPQPGESNPLAVLATRMRTIDFKKLLESVH